MLRWKFRRNNERDKKMQSVTSDGLWYAKYVTCSIALIQLTKPYLRTTAIILKMREQILQRICFEIRKNNSLITGMRFGGKATSAERFL